MVDGLDGEKTATWEGGDFATIVHQLKLLGFNAVRLPFLFGDLYTQPPQVSLVSSRPTSHPPPPFTPRYTSHCA